MNKKKKNKIKKFHPALQRALKNLKIQGESKKKKKKKKFSTHQRVGFEKCKNYVIQGE